MDLPNTSLYSFINCFKFSFKSLNPFSVFDGARVNVFFFQSEIFNFLKIIEKLKTMLIIFYIYFVSILFYFFLFIDKLLKS